MSTCPCITSAKLLPPYGPKCITVNLTLAVVTCASQQLTATNILSVVVDFDLTLVIARSSEIQKSNVSTHLLNIAVRDVGYYHLIIPYSTRDGSTLPLLHRAENAKSYICTLFTFSSDFYWIRESIRLPSSYLLLCSSLCIQLAVASSHMIST